MSEFGNKIAYLSIILAVLILVYAAKLLMRFAPDVWGMLNGGR